MGCTDEMFQALAIPLLEQHGASGHTAKLLAQEQWGKGVEECKKQMTPKKRSGIGKMDGEKGRTEETGIRWRCWSR